VPVAAKEDAAATGGATTDEPAAEDGDATVTEVELVPVEPVPFCAMAICSNIAWVLLAVGLIENVMPLPQ
jgi:hypothetical protein